MKKAINRIVSVILALCTIAILMSTAFAADSSSNVSLVKELLQNGTAETTVESLEEAVAIRSEVQAYIDAAYVASETPTVVAQIAQRSKTLKLSLSSETSEISEGELNSLSASATTVESIDSFIKGKLSYDHEAAKTSTALSLASSSATAKGALSTGKAICQGYANLFTLLAENAGIESVKVRGYLENGEFHVMNVIRTADGAYMAVDVTSNDASDTSWSLGKTFAEYCQKVGFVPSIDVGTAFSLKYGN